MILTWPPGTPADIEEQLGALGAADRLCCVPEQVLAAICKLTSDFGLEGLAINPEGFGGYYGQHVGWAYPTRPQGFTSAELCTPRTFATQAQVAAATLAGYGLPLAQALAEYVKGTYATDRTAWVTAVLSWTDASPSLTFGPTTSPAPVPAPQPEETPMAALGIATGHIEGTGREGLFLITPAGKVHIPTPADEAAWQEPPFTAKPTKLSVAQVDAIPKLA